MGCVISAIKTHYLVLNERSIKIKIWGNEKIANNDEIILDITCNLSNSKVPSFAVRKYIRDYCNSPLFIDDLNGFILFRTVHVKDVYKDLNVPDHVLFNVSWKVNEQLADVLESNNKFIITIVVQCNVKHDYKYSITSVCSYMAACIALYSKHSTIPVDSNAFFKIADNDIIIRELDFFYFQK